MNYNQKYNYLLFLFTFLLLIFAYINFDRLNITFDEKFRSIMFDIRGEIPTSSNVTIIDIDEKSIENLGQWPFPRIYMAQVLANLTNANAGVIGLDIVFDEYDRSSPSYMAKELGIKGDYQNNDNILANVLSKTPTIIGYYFNNNRSKNLKPKCKTTFNISKSKNILKFSNAITNIPELTSAAYSSGFFNALRDYDGNLIKMPLIAKYNGKIYPSLTLEMLSVASHTNQIKLLKNGSSLYAIGLNNINIPISDNGFMRINFTGKKHTFKYLSFYDILNGNFNEVDIKNKFILIGTSAIGLADLRSTIYDRSMPGVEIHANVIDNILRGDFLYSDPYQILFDIAIIFLFTLVLGFILLRSSSILMVLMSISIVIFSYYIFYELMFSYGLIFNLFYPLLAIVTTTLIAFYINNVKETKQKEFIKDKFSKKVSIEVVNELLSNPTDNFKAIQKEITIFFSDIRSFTTISEKFNNPQKLIDLLNLYLEPMTSIIIENKGTVDKFIGDAIMAYWNAPNKLKNHSNYAIESALKQMDMLDKLNKKLKKEFDTTLEIGIGIHTGLVVVGEMGSKDRSDYTIIGDNVNLASRIEGLTKYFGSKILISNCSKELLTKKYNLKYIASVIVKGKTKSIELYEVLSKNDYKKYKNIKTNYEDAIKNYKLRNFDIALKLFYKIADIDNSKINKIYINKIIELQKSSNKNLSLDFQIDTK